MSTLLVLLIVSMVHAQVDTLWSKVYQGGPDNDWAEKVIQTRDQGFLMAGWYWSDENARDFFLVKTDSMGEQQWSHVYRYNFHDFLYSVAQTMDGGYLMAGYVEWGNNDAWLVKVDSTGEQIWARGYGESGDEFKDVLVDSSNQIIVAGSNSHGWLMKLDEEGEVIWNRTYGGRAGDLFHRVIPTLDRGFLLVGFSDSFGNSRQGYVVKTDSEGEEQWHSTFGGRLIDYFQAGIALTNGHYVLAGGTEQPDRSEDFFLVEVDSSGEEQWSRIFDEDGTDRLNDLLLAPQSGYLIVGEYVGDRLHGHEYAAIRIDDRGNIQWEFDIGRQVNGLFKSGLVCPDGSFIFTGPRATTPQRASEFWLVRTTPDTLMPMELEPLAFEHDFGEAILDSSSSWRMQVRNPSRRYTLIDSISVNDSLGVFSCAYDSIVNLPDEDTTSFQVTFRPQDDVRYEGGLNVWFGGDSINIALTGEGRDLAVPLEDNLLVGYTLYPPVPNPFNSSTRISFSVGAYCNTPLRLAIYDLSGREVADFPHLLAGGEQMGGSRSVTWDASASPASVYFVRLQAGEEVASKKVVLIR